MNCTGSNTLAINRPSMNNMASLQCNSTCGELGHADPLNKNKLGPRRQREKVREQIKDYILHMLGAPVVKLELDAQNLDFCVDQAMKIFEDYAGREYFQYYVFDSVPGKSIYEMPPEVGMIRNIFYKEVGNYAFQASDLGGSIPIEYFYPGGSYNSIQGGLIDPVHPIWGRMGEWTLYKQYEQMYSRTSSALGGWEFLGGFNSIKLYPVPYRVQKVMVHYLQKNKDWSEVTQAMQEGALTYAKEILGRIRSKYQSVPGAGGSVALDGSTLIQEAREDRQKWFEDLIYKFGDLPYISLD
jgi:hypothetical protein